MAKTMLLESGLSKGFWAEAVNTACYIQNRVFLRLILKKIPMNYEKEENPTSLTFISLDLTTLFLTPRTNYQNLIQSLILGYSSISKVYRAYNKKIQFVEETVHITFKERKKDVDSKL